jgi:hypothetical protein
MEPDKTIKDQWVHVVVQNPGTSGEELMGYTSDQIPEPFIPAFATRNEAMACFMIMPKDVMKKKYEVHAMLKEDLMEPRLFKLSNQDLVSHRFLLCMPYLV